jgi:hypothetical protein
MNDQLHKWQQQYQNSTPVVNSQKLVEHVKAKQKRDKLIAWSEIIFGTIISIYCLVAMFLFAENWQAAVIYGVLSPVPFSFSMWSFKNRKKQWQQANLNTQSLLNFKRQDALWQKKYWRISALVVTILWTLLLITGLVAYFNYDKVQPWLLLVGVNAIVVLITLIKYYTIKLSLPSRLKAIEELRG